VKLFGTDGIRGVFGEPPIERRTLTRLARKLGQHLQESNPEPIVLIGGDTRGSTETIYQWLSAGLAAGGARVRWAGVIATPGVAYLTRHLQADCGIAISASHNPHRDNGIKLIDREGFKWDGRAERQLEEALATDSTPFDAGPGAPEPAAEEGLLDAYLASLRSSCSEARPLEGLDLALDTANGAASPYAADFFTSLGANVRSSHDQPDGTNINVDCGSTHDAAIAALTLETGSDLGIAFDGDADRLIAVDEKGNILNGDALLFLWATGLKAAGKLEPAAIVVTKMSNLGLDESLARVGVDVSRCEVGDRAVVQRMREEGILLGGEQSGHLVHLGLATTGDGVSSALQVARFVCETPASRLVADFEPYPQLLRNVAVGRKPEFGAISGLPALLDSVEDRLGKRGRVFLRYSGTEPVARIMLEGPEKSELESMASELEAHLARHLA